jgi:Na+-driven multidrug efflux pump
MRANRHYDITQGNLRRSILCLTWPNTISQTLLMLPSLYDAVWLGRLGPGAQAAAGLTMSVRMTMVSLMMALSIGGGAVVARYLGARDQDRANLATLQAVILMLLTAGGLGLIGLVFLGAPPHAAWVGPTPRLCRWPCATRASSLSG